MAWKRLPTGLKWPRISADDTDTTVKITARMYSPDGLLKRYRQCTIGGMVAGAAVCVLIVLFYDRDNANPAHLLITAPIIIGMGFCAGRGCYPLARFWKTKAVVLVALDHITARGPGVAAAYPLEPGGRQYMVAPHPNARWEAEQERQRQEVLRYNEDKDNSPYPSDLRHIYQNAFIVAFVKPLGDFMPLATVYMDATRAETLRNAIEMVDRRLEETRQKRKPPNGDNGTAHRL